MTKTFTPSLDFTATPSEKEQKNTFLEIAEPSNQTIQNILNFSKNIEVKQSKFVKEIEFLKS